MIGSTEADPLQTNSDLSFGPNLEVVLLDHGGAGSIYPERPRDINAAE